jgi:hypothetical protein
VSFVRRQKKTPESVLSGAGFDGPLYVMTASAVGLNSECTQNNCAEKNKNGADRKRIESQGQVHHGLS